VTVVTDLGTRAGGTWYLRLGDAFAWVCMAALALLLSWRALRWRTSAANS
jgi:hypothetical protein